MIRRGSQLANSWRRWARDTGEVLSPVVTDRMLFAYEMGYLRGRSDATQETLKMFDDVARSREETKKESHDDDAK